VLIAACVKWVDLSPDVDPLHGGVETRPHGSGLSAADLAAVEVALRLGEAWGASVTVTSLGPVGVEPALRELLACGATAVRRVAVEGTHGEAALSSAETARLLADAWSGLGETPDVVVCGDMSVDRGSGSVPAFLAHELGAAQALGLIEVTPTASWEMSALRRLDGGRRERLMVGSPAVLSVEGSVADIRRAPLAAMLGARALPVEVVAARSVEDADAPRMRPWRPRPRALPGPAGDRALDRIVALTGALSERTPPRTLVLDPPEAARAILDQLSEWGYLPKDG
jgi:electron transfer flavoprotein beta subunit